MALQLRVDPLGSLHCAWNEIELAEQCVWQGIALGEQAGQGIYMASIYLLAAQVLWVRGKMEDALEILARAEQGHNDWEIVAPLNMCRRFGRGWHWRWAISHRPRHGAREAIAQL